MPNHRVVVNILSRRRLIAPGDGRRLLVCLYDVLPEAAPELYGNYEPIRGSMSLERIEDGLNAWVNPFLWRRRRSSAEGSVWMSQGSRPLHGWVTLSFPISVCEVHDPKAFLTQLALTLDADFGFAHVLHPSEIPQGEASGTVTFLDREHKRPELGVTTHQLSRFIPDVYWGTVFGEAYVRHFGAPRLRQVPAALVEELRDDLFYLQLTDRIEDCVTDWESVRRRRIAVKRHLGEDSFFHPDGGRTYRVPEFHFLD